MIYKIAACEFQPGIYKDALFSDDLWLLPGDEFITSGNIKKFYDYENYKILSKDDDEIEIQHNKEVYAAYRYYYEIWENCKEFGLPENGDWTKNPVWLVDFVKYFNRISNDVEIYRFEKERRLNR